MRRTETESAPIVLVVDDDATATADLTRWLYAQGFNAVCAASALEAAAVLEVIPVRAMIGHLALPDGSLFDLARKLRNLRQAIIIGYAEVDVRPPPELDACFVRPLDLDVLGGFLQVRFGRRRSGEHVRVAGQRDHSVPAAKRRAVQSS